MEVKIRVDMSDYNSRLVNGVWCVYVDELDLWIYWEYVLEDDEGHYVFVTFV